MLKLITLSISLYIIICLVNSFPTNTNSKGTGHTEEIQNAMCNVITKDITAKAIAVTTRQLTGVCSSNEIDLKLKLLESKLMREFSEIKRALQMNGFKISESTTVTTTDKSDLLLDYGDYATATEKYQDSFAQNYNYKYYKNLESNSSEKNADVTLLNPNEILLYNDSIVQTENGDVYYYFWKIDDIHNVLLKKDVYISSPEFSVMGHLIRLQFYPNYLPEYAEIMLRPHSKGFIKRHKFTVFNKYFTSEISSGVLMGFTNDEKMFKIHRSMVEDGFLSNGDELVIKLTLFLDS